MAEGEQSQLPEIPNQHLLQPAESMPTQKTGRLESIGVKNGEKLRAIPDAEFFTQDHWKEWFEDHDNLGFSPEEVKKGTKLLAALSKGVNDAYEYLYRQRAHERKITPPVKIKIVTDVNSSFGMQYNRKNKTIEVSLQYLWKASQKENVLEQEIKQTTGASSTVFPGTYEELFYFGGIEECDHAMYFYDHPEERDKKLLNPRKNGNSLEEYNSQPHEVHALQTQLVLAKREPQRYAGVITYLQEQIKAAKEFMLRNNITYSS